MAQIYTGPTSHRSITQTVENGINVIASYTEGAVEGDENAQTAQYLRTSSNIFQVFTGDYDNNRAIRRLNNFQSSSEYNRFLTDIGMHDANTNMQNFTLHTDAATTVRGSDLSNADISAIKSGDTTTVNGATIGGFQNNVTRQFSDLVNKSIDETTGLNKLSGSTTDKLSSFQDIKQSAIDKINTFDTIHNFSGSHMDCQAAIASLTAQRLVASGNERRKIEKQLNTISTYDSYFSRAHATPHGFTAAQQAGLSSIAHHFVGDNMMQGINFYRGGINIASSSIRGGLNASRALVMNSARIATGGIRVVALSADFITRHVPGFSSGVTNATGRFSNATKRMNRGVNSANDRLKTRHKENRNARKNGTRRELRHDRKVKRVDRRTSNLEAKRIRTKADAKQKLSNASSTRTSADIRKARKAKERDNRCKTKLKRRHNRLSGGKTLRDRANTRLINGRYTGRILNLKTTLAKFNPLKLLNRLLGGMFGFFKKAKLIIMASPVVLILLIAAVAGILSILLRFISSLTTGTDFVGALENQNFCQICVDATEGDLATNMLNVFKADANRRYNVWDYLSGEAEAVASDKYDWYKRATDGKIESIVSSENHDEELASLNANIVPITSMMHCRYFDCINFDSYFTCQAYMYYMYIMSHRVLSEEIIEVPDCDIIYSPISGTDKIVSWDEATQTLTRGEKQCSNEYLHGYDSSKYQIIADARMFAEKSLYSVLDILGCSKTEISYDLLKSNGVWHAGNGEYLTPSDSMGDCDNYIQVRYSTTPTCGMENHAHTAKPGYSGTSGQVVGCYTWNTTTSSDWVSSGTTTYPKSVVLKDSETTKYTKKSESGGMVTYNKSTLQNTTSGSWVLSCNKSEHVHTPWSESNHGCYDTAYICLGHCGGHVTPILTIEVDTEYETLMQLDTFITPTIIGATSFDDITTGVFTAICPSYDLYQAYWHTKMMSWFIPGPWSTVDRLSSVGQDIYKGMCKGIDGVSGWIAGLVGGLLKIDDEDVDDAAETVNLNKATDIEDMYSFEGWTNDDGTINEDSLDNLISFYGPKYDGDTEGVGYYDLGKENWLTIGDVIFSDGMNRKLTGEQITNIIGGMSTTDNNKKICKVALETCGQYWLNEMMTEDVTKDYGEANIDSWIDYIYRTSIGKSITSTSTTSSNDVNPGTILVNDKGGKGIYIGNIEKEILDELPIKDKIFNSNYCIILDDSGARLVPYKRGDWQSCQR